MARKLNLSSTTETLACVHSVDVLAIPGMCKLTDIIIIYSTVNVYINRSLETRISDIMFTGYMQVFIVGGSTEL